MRQTARSARFPGSSEPMSSRPIARAPPRVASCKACARRHRAGPAAAAGDEQRLLHLEEEVAALVRRRPVDAEPDVDPGVDELAHRGDAGAEAEVRGRAVRDADAVGAEPLDLVLREVDAVRAPDVVAEPADAIQVLDGPAAVELAAVGLLLDRLGEVGVQAEAEAAGELGRLLHQPRRDREGRAGRDDDLRHRAVDEPGEPLGVGEDVVDLLDEVVGRKAAVRDAEVHRAARGDDADADLGRGAELGLDEPGDAAREDVVVVEDGRAARERELGEARCGRRRRASPRRSAPRPGRASAAR